MTKQEVLEEIAEELANISDSLTEIHSDLEDLSMSSKIMVFLKMMDMRPAMKEKLEPVIDELAAAMDLSMAEAEEEEE
ncbi:MAG TPA: hypothetical protein PLN19_02600 [Methanothrix sp.]|jgi:hypothetical protein|nr:hypothetical protein [Methanothrix sp.]HOV82648.1 hypothetical protein [Methanothrix sp.]HPC89224.1 hypothetical protein [Methanothrix sp.]HQE87143.1 hypothetical protein [Methanothrix sp.]HQI67745.1 hypothetical protein [Methanothrix sp.]